MEADDGNHYRAKQVSRGLGPLRPMREKMIGVVNQYVKDVDEWADDDTDRRFRITNRGDTTPTITHDVASFEQSFGVRTKNAQIAYDFTDGSVVEVAYRDDPNVVSMTANIYGDEQLRQQVNDVTGLEHSEYQPVEVRLLGSLSSMYDRVTAGISGDR